MLNDSDRVTSHLLLQRHKFEPSALNPTRAHHRRFLVIGVIGVIASCRSKRNPQPRNDLRTIIGTASSASSAASASSSASLRHTDRTQPPAAKRLAHHHRRCVIGVIGVIGVISIKANSPAAIRRAHRKSCVWME